MFARLGQLSMLLYLLLWISLTRKLCPIWSIQKIQIIRLLDLKRPFCAFQLDLETATAVKRANELSSASIHTSIFSPTNHPVEVVTGKALCFPRFLDWMAAV